MHTIELFELAVHVAELAGYHVRHEYLGGQGGGVCEFGGRRWVFIDLALNTVEQLEQLCTAFADMPELTREQIPQSLHPWMTTPVPSHPASESSRTHRAA